MDSSSSSAVVSLGLIEKVKVTKIRGPTNNLWGQTSILSLLRRAGET